MPLVNTIEIANFKGIRSCKIEDLKQINLFIGGNNSGKSTILEAIYSVCKETVGTELPFALRRRTEGRNISARDLWYGYDLKNDVMVRLRFDNDVALKMTLKYQQQEVLSFIHQEYGGRETRIKHNTYGGLVNLPHRGTSVSGVGVPPEWEEIYAYSNSAIFLDPAIKTKSITIESSYLNKLKLSGKDPEVVRAFKEIYGTGENLEYIPHPDLPSEHRATLLMDERKIFLDNLGDGPRYGLVILAAAQNLTNTALFIEEIETHQHPGAIKKLVNNLIEIARTNNLQLFITTHSFDVWRYLYYYYSEHDEIDVRKKEFRTFHIRYHSDGKVEATIEDNVQKIKEDIFEIQGY
jgi:AAA15 family ATPase/GTPase